MFRSSQASTSAAARRPSRIASLVPLFFATLFLPMLAATELLNAFDGTYRGDMIRFNPAMKWWGWIFSGGVFALSACLLASERRIARLAATLILLLLSTYAFDVPPASTLRIPPTDA